LREEYGCHSGGRPIDSLTFTVPLHFGVSGNERGKRERVRGIQMFSLQIVAVP